VPVNKLYSAAFGPGFLLAGLYIVYCLVRSYLNPALGPAVPKEERVGNIGLLLKEAVLSVVPLAALIAATLGTILAGLATATEAAACGATGATLLALAYRKLTWKALVEACRSTMLTSCMVLFLVMASNVFGAVFVQTGASSVLSNVINLIPLPDMGKLVLIMAIIFVLGWPFEWPAIVLVFLPIFLPVVEKLNLGLDKAELLIWFGAAVAVNLQTAFLSPPVAMSAYYLKNVMPRWSLAMIFRGMSQFMVLQVIVLLAMIMFPQVALWFPRFLQE
jgi:tripartite ATP-independent transporter DctM subunit